MPKFGGRQKGTVNKQTKTLQETAERLGCDPFEILCRFALGDWKGLGYKSEHTLTPTQKGEVVERPIITPEIRHKAAAEAAQYLHPKRKAVEHTGEVKQVFEERLTPQEIEIILRSDPFLGETSGESH